MAVFFWPCQDEVLDVQCKGLEVVVSRREGFICKQAQKVLQCVQVSLPGAHTGLCQRVSRQAGGMGFQGAGAGAGGPAVSLRTPHVCSLLPGGDGNAAALRVDVVEANLTERARGSDTAATGMGLWHRFASFLSLTQLLL